VKIKQVTVIVILISLLTACNSKKEPELPRSCLESMPKTISGLKVTGARSEQNVIKNMWPVTCAAKEVYQDRLKKNSKLKGKLVIKLSVEFNGEIGPFSIVEDTLEDPIIKNSVMNYIRYHEFDWFGAHNSETDIVYPIHLEP
jgi:hypothetical protein